MVTATDAALALWIDPQHLVPAMMAEYYQRFIACRERYVVIDDFLVSSHLPHLRNILLEDGMLQSFYKIYGTSAWVSREEFEGVGADQHFIYEKIYVGPRDGRQMSPAILTDLQFRHIIRSRAFHHWLRTITGLPVNETGRINLKRLGREHLLRWHSDGIKGRLLCAILYLHDDWQGAYGGRFLMQRHDGGIDSIEPLINRLILFDPHSGMDHAVEAMSEAAGEWARLNYTIWFY